MKDGWIKLGPEGLPDDLWEGLYKMMEKASLTPLVRQKEEIKEV